MAWISSSSASLPFTLVVTSGGVAGSPRRALVTASRTGRLYWLKRGKMLARPANGEVDDEDRVVKSFIAKWKRRIVRPLYV